MHIRVARVLAVGMVALVWPTGGAGPVGAMAPGPPLRQIAGLLDQVPAAHGRLPVVRIELGSRTRRPDRIAADLSHARARLAVADQEIALATAEAAAQHEATDEAERAVKDARSVRDAAQEAVTAAEEAMSAARDRLADLMAAAEAAASARAQAAARVVEASVGSKTRRATFTAWQMAAIADRAAHARRIVAEEVGAEAFEQLGALAVTLAEAEVALTAARSERGKAGRSTEEYTAVLAALEAGRQALAAEVEALTAEAAQAAGSPVPEVHPTGGGHR